MSHNRKVDLTVEQVHEYESMINLGREAQRFADYFHTRRRRMEDEFAQMLDFSDRKDAKRSGFSVQVYARNREVVAHSMKTLPTFYLCDIKSGILIIENNSEVDVYAGRSQNIRPRDGSLKVEAGNAIQWPVANARLYMAVDSITRVPVFLIRKPEEEHKVWIYVGMGPEDAEPLE